jgi:hypothetical protein
MEQTMESLVAIIGRLEAVIQHDRAEMKANQANMDVNPKEIEAEVRLSHE